MHKARIPIIDVAVNDVILTIVLALFTAKFNINILPLHLLFWFITAEIAHKIFCVQTKVITFFV